MFKNILFILLGVLLLICLFYPRYNYNVNTHHARNVEGNIEYFNYANPVKCKV